jgi:hypothetical protein
MSSVKIPKAGRVTEFKQKDNYSQTASIEHRSLDKLEREAALSISEKKKLRKKTHEELLKVHTETLKKRKMLKDPRLQIENNEKIAKKNDQQREFDKLMFDAKMFVAKATKTPAEIKQIEDRERLLQGHQVKREKGQHKNYKQLLQEKKIGKETEKMVRQDEKDTGMFNWDKDRKQEIIKAHKRSVDQFMHMAKHGAPSDVGKAIPFGKHRMRAVGSIGNWQGGMLKLSKRDVLSMSGNKHFSKKK